MFHLRNVAVYRAENVRRNSTTANADSARRGEYRWKRRTTGCPGATCCLCGRGRSGGDAWSRDFPHQIAGAARTLSPARRSRPGCARRRRIDEWTAQAADFTLGGGASSLVGVRALPSAGARPASVTRERAFVAVFDPVRGQRPAGDLIHAASHAEYGPLPLYLSAASDPRAPGRMLAVFN